MTTIILAVIVGILVLDRLFSFRVDKFDYDVLESRTKAFLSFQKEAYDRNERIAKRLNDGADRENEVVRALQELGDNLGYCIHIEEGVEGTLEELQSGSAKYKKRLVVHKKVAEKKKRGRR